MMRDPGFIGRRRDGSRVLVFCGKMVLLDDNSRLCVHGKESCVLCDYSQRRDIDGLFGGHWPTRGDHWWQNAG